MTQADREADFTEYISARSPWLVRVAYLLCGDWHRAEDLAQVAAGKLYQHWARAARADSIDASSTRPLISSRAVSAPDT